MDQTHVQDSEKVTGGLNSDRRSIDSVLSGLLSLEMGARMQAGCAASSAVAESAKCMADFYGSAATAILEAKALIAGQRRAIKFARIELAALLPNPRADDPEWPDDLNEADKQCLTDAYDALTAVTDSPALDSDDRSESIPVA